MGGKDDVLLLPGPQQPQLTLEDANDLSSGVGGAVQMHTSQQQLPHSRSLPRVGPSDDGTMSAMSSA